MGVTRTPEQSPTVKSLTAEFGELGGDASRFLGGSVGGYLLHDETNLWAMSREQHPVQ